MPQNVRPAPKHCFVLAGAAALLGCPQLLEDDFGTVTLTPDGGELACAGGECSNYAGSGGSAGADSDPSDGPLAGGSSGAGGRGGAETTGGGGSGGSGISGAGGTSSLGGASGAAGTAGAGGSGGTTSSPDCWKLALHDSTHSDTGNCLGIEGWNQVEVDTTPATTAVDLSYPEGNVCFQGHIGTGGWGAVYSLTFQDQAGLWNAVTHGVGGFEVGLSGAQLPPTLQVIYTDVDGDCCRELDPVESTAIPFDSTRPNCTATETATRVPDATQLKYIRLVLKPEATDYDIDFCVELRAIP